MKNGKELYEKYRGAMAYIEVRLPDGDISIGSCFHIGDGVFVTAKHVVEGNEITSISTTEHYHVPNPNGNVRINGSEQRYESVSTMELTIKSGPYFHQDEKIDVAAIVVVENDMTLIPLGWHLDNWINDSDFVMANVIIMGYPPIPFSKEPILIAAQGQINAVVDKYSGPHPHFIISAMPRGGFSGGACLIEWDFALGLIVESLISNHKENELGFMSVISVEPIHELLAHHKIMPRVQDLESESGAGIMNPFSD